MKIQNLDSGRKTANLVWPSAFLLVLLDIPRSGNLDGKKTNAMNFKADFNYYCPVAGTWEKDVKVWFSRRQLPRKALERAENNGKRLEEGGRVCQHLKVRE